MLGWGGVFFISPELRRGAPPPGLYRRTELNAISSLLYSQLLIEAVRFEGSL